MKIDGLLELSRISPDDSSYDGLYLEVLNAIHRSMDNKKIKTSFIAYCRKNSIDIKDFNALDDHAFLTAGKVAFMATSGVRLPERAQTWLSKKIETLREQGEIAAIEKKKQPKKKKDKPEVKKENKISEISNKLISLATEGKLDEDRDAPYRVLSTEQIKSPMVTMILHAVTEVLSIYEAPDQHKEHLKGVPAKKIKKIRQDLQAIQEQVQFYLDNLKATTIKRTAKVVSSERLVKQVKYKPEDEYYKVVSVNPAKIVGSKYLVVFNTKTRKLGIYEAADSKGLSVKGTSLVNWDEKKSTQKTLRKPQDVLGSFRNTTITEMKKSFDGITTVEIPLSGRLNEEVVLLAVF